MWSTACEEVDLRPETLVQVPGNGLVGWAAVVSDELLEGSQHGDTASIGACDGALRIPVQAYNRVSCKATPTQAQQAQQART